METQATVLTRRYPNIRIASLRLHWSVPTRPDATRTNAVRAAGDLWGWVQEDEGVSAFLLAITLPLINAGKDGESESLDREAGTGWRGHEAFYIVAPDLQMLDSADEVVDGMKLKEEWWPGVKYREGWWDGEVAGADESEVVETGPVTYNIEEGLNMNGGDDDGEEALTIVYEIRRFRPFVPS